MKRTVAFAKSFLAHLHEQEGGWIALRLQTQAGVRYFFTYTALMALKPGIIACEKIAFGTKRTGRLRLDKALRIQKYLNGPGRFFRHRR